MRWMSAADAAAAFASRQAEAVYDVQNSVGASSEKKRNVVGSIANRGQVVNVDTLQQTCQGVPAPMRKDQHPIHGTMMTLVEAVD